MTEQQNAKHQQLPLSILKQQKTFFSCFLKKTLDILAALVSFSHKISGISIKKAYLGYIGKASLSR